jgi:hypothetical protein
MYYLYSLLALLLLPIYAFREVLIDFIIDLLPLVNPLLNYYYNVLLVVVYYLIKYSCYITIYKKLISNILIDLFIYYIYKNYRLLDNIVLDRGSLFTSYF